MYPKNSKTHKLLAILTSTAEGTMRQLTKSSHVDSNVRCKASRRHHVPKRQQRLCASQFSQVPIPKHNTNKKHIGSLYLLATIMFSQ